MPLQSVMVFGATGAIGVALVKMFSRGKCFVYAVSRDTSSAEEIEGVTWLSMDIHEETFSKHFPAGAPTINAVVWAQGANCSDSIYSFDRNEHERLYSVNVIYILVSLQRLIQEDLLAPSARLCVISSIWQNIAKQNKLSYSITKSALQGLVQSLAIDLGGSGHLINAVLPGALDTPMTRANLTGEQIQAFEKMSPLSSLPTMDDVCGLVSFLCSETNTGITGQFVAADRGFSYARII